MTIGAGRGSASVVLYVRQMPTARQERDRGRTFSLKRPPVTCALPSPDRTAVVSEATHLQQMWLRFGERLYRRPNLDIVPHLMAVALCDWLRPVDLTSKPEKESARKYPRR